jgi:rod shape-determining protein MreD
VTPTLAQRLDILARNMVPAAFCVLLVMLSAIPLYIPGYAPTAANLVLMAVFYWAVHRPDLLSPIVAFLLGLLQDVLTGSPPGTNALVLVLVHTVAISQGRVFRGRSFALLWWGFGLVAFAATFVHWGVSVAYNLVWLDPLPAFFRAAITTALFPFLAALFTLIQQKLLPQA